MLSKEASGNIFETLVWLELGLNPSLPDYWWTLYSLGQWSGLNIYIYSFKKNSIITKILSSMLALNSAPTHSVFLPVLRNFTFSNRKHHPRNMIVSTHFPVAGTHYGWISNLNDLLRLADFNLNFTNTVDFSWN